MKSYIICMKGNRISEDLSNELIDSLSKFSIQYEVFNAIHGDEIESIWEKNKLKLYHKQNDNRKSSGVRGCFLSHYLLWDKCIKINQPILILEHDALIIRNIPNNILDIDYDVLNLDYASRVEDEYETHLNTDKGDQVLSWHLETTKKGWISKINASSIKGAHAYIVKPAGAKKLVNKAHENGTLPADVHINSMYVDLRYTSTSYARINPRYWNNNKKNSKNSFTREKK